MGTTWDTLRRTPLHHPMTSQVSPGKLNTLLSMVQGLDTDLADQEEVRRVRSDYLEQCRVHIAQLTQEKNQLQSHVHELEVKLDRRSKEHDKAMERVAREHQLIRQEMADVAAELRSETHAQLEDERSKREAAEAQVANAIEMLTKQVRFGMDIKI